MKRYSIWDKISPVITPSGELFTADQWKERYPVATLPNISILGSAGPINGGFFGVLQQMVAELEGMGYDFSSCVTDEDYVNRIEEIEDSRSATVDNTMSTPEERIAAALEALEMNSLPTVNDDDPDAE